jgi:two-component system response regulator YesN
MIADDEGIVIDALRFIIEKNYGKDCILESAKSGREVIELADKLRPDIIFMDIEMPGINGIEAIKEIRSSNSSTIFIIISAYPKFNYAKEAINLGVLEYINKPIEQKKIIEVLDKAIKKTDEKRELRSKDLQVREKLEIVVPIIESGFIYSLLFEDAFAENIDNYKQLLNIVEKMGYIMTIKYGDSNVNGKLSNAVGISVKMQPKYQEMRRIIKDYFNCVVGAMMGNLIIVYVPYNDDAKNKYKKRLEIIEQARKLNKNLKNSFSLNFQISIGNIKPIQETIVSYKESINAFNFADSSVTHAGDLPLTCHYYNNYPIDEEKAMFQAIKHGKNTTAVMYATQFIERLIDIFSNNLEGIKLKILENELLAERIVYDSGGKTYYFESRDGYLEHINNMNTIAEIKDWFIEKIQEQSNNVATKKDESNKGMILRAKEYIQEHYQNEISLDDVSKELDISPYYLSKVFKQKTGQNFIEYLTEIRIERAKELILQGTDSIKKISLSVGYPNPNYFSRTFKKNVGVSPSEYKGGE